VKDASPKNRTKEATPMTVIMIAEQPNMDERTYSSMLEPLMPLLRSANGFISHAGGPSPAGGMRIIEIWESEVHQKQFFEENLKENLPPGLVPDLTYYELHAGFARGAATWESETNYTRDRGNPTTAR
jgi:hypothetical protein